MLKVLAGQGWTDSSREVLARACDRYGGFETWHALSEIRLFPRRLSGFVPWLKGAERTFPTPSLFEIRPHQRWARFSNYPDADHVGVFDDGAVRLERRDSNAVLASDDHRASFHGLAKNRRWTPLDALYFFGYALTHYHSLPFSLFDARLVRARELGRRSNRLSVLDVELPADLPSHCRDQRFYFDKSGLLVRHDYHTEIIGVWARGAHFWKRQTSVGGFPVALDRHVLARLGSVALPITALHATFADAEVDITRTSNYAQSLPRVISIE